MIFVRRADGEIADDSPTFIGTALALTLGLIGGVAAEKALGGGGGGSSSSSATATASPTNTIGGTPTPPPTVGVASGQATQQATIAAQRQRKRAAAGETLLTPNPTGFGSATPIVSLVPKALLGVASTNPSAPRSTATLLGGNR